MVRAGWIPSVRLFEAACCATPVISDAWPGLDTLFAPGREILLAERPEEVLSALGAPGVALRDPLATAARRRVLAAHTAAHRAAELEAHLRAARRGKAAAATSPRGSTVVVAGGARVVCVDNLLTGRTQNIAHLAHEPRFEMVEADVCEPLPQLLHRRAPRIGAVFNLACAASPPHHQADPEHTLLTCVLGTRHLLRLAEAAGARFVQASTCEV